MSDKKLTYEEWREGFGDSMTVSDEVRKKLKELYKIDADFEIELAMRKLYDNYTKDK